MRDDEFRIMDEKSPEEMLKDRLDAVLEKLKQLKEVEGDPPSDEFREICTGTCALTYIRGIFVLYRELKAVDMDDPRQEKALEDLKDAIAAYTRLASDVIDRTQKRLDVWKDKDEDDGDA